MLWTLTKIRQWLLTFNVSNLTTERAGVDPEKKIKIGGQI